MENGPDNDFLESSSDGSFQIPGEPAIVINDLPPIIISSDNSNLISSPVETYESQSTPPGFWKWFEGREVMKKFGDEFFRGKVTQFDEEMGWYRVVYEDGDFEDLEGRELEEVLVPLDVNMPLKTLALKTLKKRQKQIQKPARDRHGKGG